MKARPAPIERVARISRYCGLTPLLLIAVSLHLPSSEFGGPAHPKRDARAHLSSRGYDATLIERVVHSQAIDASDAAEFSHSPSPDVRFLIARNEYIPDDVRDALSRDRNDFTRSGAAHNPKLTTEQVERLFHDRSHTVYAALARNRGLSEEMLLKLHRERKPGLVYFAMNPHCPPEIQREIEQSNNQIAKQWLNRKRKAVR